MIRRRDFMTFMTRALMMATVCLLMPLTAGADDSASVPKFKFLETERTPLDPVGSRGSVIVMEGREGIETAPIPEATRLEMLADFDQDRAFGRDPQILYFVNPRALEEIERTRNGAPLHPYLQQFADPERGCSSETKVKTRTFPLNWDGFSLEDSIGPFNGTLSANADIQGQATLKIKYKVKKVFCIPIWVKFRNLRVFGNATLGGEIGLEGSLSNLSNPWKWSRQIAKPHLGSINFWAGPIPVHIGFNLPITVGVQAGVSVSAEVGYQATGGGTGTFDYTCTTSGCSGSSSFNLNGLTAPAQVTASLEGRADLRGWVDVAARAYLYSESVVYAQVGVRPVLYGDIWGYWGNTCGDLDCDGTPETVSALTADLDWQLFVTAKADTFVTSPNEWNLWSTSRSHIAFFDLLGDSSALDPLLRGPYAVSPGDSGTLSGRMRSCWPYDSFVNYSVEWPDGSSESFSNPPDEREDFEHTFQGSGYQDVTLTAVTDHHGRTLGNSEVHSVRVRPVPSQYYACGNNEGDSGGPLSSGLQCVTQPTGGYGSMDCLATVTGGQPPYTYFWRQGVPGSWIIRSAEETFDCNEGALIFFKLQDVDGSWTNPIQRNCSDAPR